MKRSMSKEEFLALYQRQQSSGLTIKDFCDNESYPASCFHYWKKKYGLSHPYTKHTEPTGDSFIPLNINHTPAIPTSSCGDRRVTIELPSGIKILNDTMRYFLCPGKTDMRKGINSLCGLVHDKMGYDVRLGDVFIFVNRSRTTMKLLHAEDGGMVLYIKRLEEGTFRLPSYDSESRSYPMEWRDLVLMVEGITDNPSDRLKRLKAGRKEGFY